MAEIPKNSYCPKKPGDWRKWLAKNHEKEESIWLVLYKKSADAYSLTWSDAVDEALCFGWIDSTKRPLDSERYLQYYSKRKPKSTWSKINKDKVEVLIEQGKMKDAGLKCIEVAKANGTWTILDKIEALEVPTELSIAFKNHPGSEPYYKSLSNSKKKLILHWIGSAKRDETVRKRVLEVVEHLSQEKLPPRWN